MRPQMTPVDLINMIKSGKNPQQLMMSFLQNGISNSNPIMANIFDLAKQNKGAEIEKIARNLAKEKGIDFDEEFNSFKKNFFGF